MKLRITSLIMSFGFLVTLFGVLTAGAPRCGAETYGGEVTGVNPQEGKLTVSRIDFQAERGRDREREFTVEPHPDYPGSLPLEDLQVGDVVLIEAGRDGEVDSLVSGWGSNRGVFLLRGNDAEGMSVGEREDGHEKER